MPASGYVPVGWESTPVVPPATPPAAAAPSVPYVGAMQREMQDAGISDNGMLQFLLDSGQVVYGGISQ